MWLVKCNFVRIIPLSCKLVTNILLRSKFLLWNVWLIIVNCFRNSFLSDTSNNCFVHYYNFNPRLPSRMVKQLSMAIHKRSVGISCHSSHVLRLWHRLFVETSNAEAHADMYINGCDYIRANDGCLQVTFAYYISMDVIVALMFDKRLGNCQIPERQAQSVK